MNWGLPPARIIEHACSARGDPECVWEIRWKNPRWGRRFWLPAGAGAAASAMLGMALVTGAALPGAATALVATPAVVGLALGYGLLQAARRREAQGNRDLVADELVHSSGQLVGKFRDLESKVDQLSLLMDLSAAVNATRPARPPLLQRRLAEPNRRAGVSVQVRRAALPQHAD